MSWCIFTWTTQTTPSTARTSHFLQRKLERIRFLILNLWSTKLGADFYLIFVRPSSDIRSFHFCHRKSAPEEYGIADPTTALSLVVESPVDKDLPKTLLLADDDLLLAWTATAETAVRTNLSAVRLKLHKLNRAPDNGGGGGDDDDSDYWSDLFPCFLLFLSGCRQLLLSALSTLLLYRT